ncbi:MAG: hypothetical protein KQH63_06040 [Desulfobulbaceae bacterium]|nr:hypothetical protein [Desulfobulbaceae bacterium]
MQKIPQKAFCIGIAVFMAISFYGTEQTQAAAKSYEFGNVTMNHATKSQGGEPVIFRHWSHRSKYTCRLCHVDLEFSQVANETGVLEEDNRAGMFCGACHNGKEAFAIDNCTACHPKNKQHAKEMERQAKRDFQKLRKNMPPSVYGNKIDWMQAEVDGKITPKDFLPGISLQKTAKLVNKRDEPRTPALPGLPDIIFSHSKHVVWNGCGMCHPDTFALETGKTKMSMKEITQGKFCGRCHGTIAFALNDCSRCHSKPISQ